MKPWEERLADLLRSAGGELQHPRTGQKVILAPASRPSGENIWNVTYSDLLGRRAKYLLIEGFGLESVTVSPNVSAPGIDDFYFDGKRQIKLGLNGLMADERTSFREQADKVVSYIEDVFSYLRNSVSN